MNKPSDDDPTGLMADLAVLGYRAIVDRTDEDEVDCPHEDDPKRVRRLVNEVSAHAPWGGELIQDS